MVFKVNAEVPVSQIFESMNVLRANFEIESYSVKQMGLAEIYEAFSRF
jgi:hypothetical protein